MCIEISCLVLYSLNKILVNPVVAICFSYIHGTWGDDKRKAWGAPWHHLSQFLWRLGTGTLSVLCKLQSVHDVFGGRNHVGWYFLWWQSGVGRQGEGLCWEVIHLSQSTSHHCLLSRRVYNDTTGRKQVHMNVICCRIVWMHGKRTLPAPTRNVEMLSIMIGN